MKTPRALLLGPALCWLLAAHAQGAVPEKQTQAERATARKGAPSGHHLDRSGKTRKGKASYYGRRFHGKKMANGETMKPDSNAAASKTLPVGTVAKVTNLDNNKSEVVVVKDPRSVCGRPHHRRHAQDRRQAGHEGRGGGAGGCHAAQAAAQERGRIGPARKVALGARPQR